MNRIILFLAAGITLLFSGCSMSELFGPGYEMRGEMKDGVYTGPDGRFSVRMPPMDKDASHWEGNPAAGVQEVFFEDGLCRRYIVSEQLDITPADSLEKWVDERLKNDLERIGIRVEEQKSVQLGQGPAVFLRYKSIGAGPCRTTATKNGKKVETSPDANVGVYVLRGGEFIYQLIYLAGIDPPLKGPAALPRGPVEDLLTSFAGGFEVHNGRGPKVGSGLRNSSVSP